MQQSLASIYTIDPNAAPVSAAMQEAEEAISQVLARSEAIALSPQNAYIRRLQHQLVERYNLASRSEGREPHRRVKIYP
jgi:predicted RNA-binding protein Jag